MRVADLQDRSRARPLLVWQCVPVAILQGVKGCFTARYPQGFGGVKNTASVPFAGEIPVQ